MAQRTYGTGGAKTRIVKPFDNISKRAFTLVELLAVMAIIAILAAITMGIYGSVKRKGVEARLNAELAAIELAIENYKAKERHYPYSSPWGKYGYPSLGWNGQSPNKHLKSLNSTNEVNELYLHLVSYPSTNGQKPYLTGIKENYHMGRTLLAPVPYPFSPDNSWTNGAFAGWNYNSYDPKYNKNSYDLWVEYGDDTVKIISNWNK